MKKVLILILIGFSFTYCEKEDEDCTCYAKYFVPGKDGFFYVPNMPVDCETRYPLKQPGTPNAVFAGCEK